MLVRPTKDLNANAILSGLFHIKNKQLDTNLVTVVEALSAADTAFIASAVDEAVKPRIGWLVSLFPSRNRFSSHI